MPPPYPITGCPHRKLCGRLFLCAGTAARGGGAVCGAVCLWDGLSAGLSAGLSMGRTVCGSGIFSRTRSGPEPGNRTGKQGNRETGNRGIGNRESGIGNRGRKSGRLVVNGRIGRPISGRFAGRMFPGRGEWPFLRSPKYLRRISCTVCNNPVYLQVRTEEANR